MAVEAKVVSTALQSILADLPVRDLATLIVLCNDLLGVRWQMLLRARAWPVPPHIEVVAYGVVVKGVSAKFQASWADPSEDSSQDIAKPDRHRLGALPKLGPAQPLHKMRLTRHAGKAELELHNCTILLQRDHLTG